MEGEVPGAQRHEDPPRFPRELLAVDPDSALNRLMADAPWNTTVLGPVDTWCPELRTVVGVCLNSPFPMLVMWGPDLAMIYNDAFVPILGAKHPALGEPCATVWADAWPVVGSMIGNVMARGESTHHEDLRLTLRRHGFDEAVYFTFAYSAIPVAGGGIGGVFTVVTETTGQVLGTRRLRTLRELGEARSARISDVAEACAAAVRVLDAHRDDVPFGVVYVLDEDGGRARAVASYGLGDPDAAPPPPLSGPLPRTVSASAEHDAAGGAWIWQAVSAGVTGTRTGLAGPVPGWAPPPDGAPADAAVVLPLVTTAGERPRGAVVLGVSPDLVLDDAYRGFLNLAASHLAAAVSDAGAMAAQLRRAEELAELDRAKTKFFTGVSHELRTPLTLIAGPAQDALADTRYPLPPAHRERLEIIHRNAGRLRRMVDTLLDFSRLEAGRLVLEPVAVELGALTRGIAGSFAPAVERMRLRFTVDCPADRGAVLVDPVLWERILLNLLSNAVKFTPDGEIRVALRIRDGWAELEVADTGMGIPPEELAYVFERFRQVGGAAGRSHEGSGVGLALVRELAELHGGGVEAAGRPGGGTAFTVRVPAHPTGEPALNAPAGTVVEDYVAEAAQWGAPAAAPVPAPAPAPAPTAVPAPDPTPDPVFRGGAGAGPPVPDGEDGSDTVLIAEDNADLRTYLASLLEPGYRVVVAADGHEALRQARRLRPDLVLADVMMPGLDGFALLRALRADPATARTPLVFLSARAGEAAAAEGLAAGADDYLAKPFSSTDLLARVRSNLNLARLRNHESAWRTALVNAMQDGFFVARADHAVIEVNAAFTQLLGYEAPHLPWPVPHPWWPTADQDPEGYALVEAALETVRAHGHGRFVLPLRHRDGHRLWVDVALDSLHDRNGDSGTHLLVGTLRDVTAQHLTAERDAAVARLAGLLAGVDDCAHVVRVGLAEFRDCWQAERVSLLRYAPSGSPGTEGPAEVPGLTATTGPEHPSGPALPPGAAAEHARAGTLFTTAGHGTPTGSPTGSPTAVTAVGAPLYDGADHALLWLEFDRPRPFTLADRTLMVQLTGHLQRALGRARVNDEHRQVALALQRAILGPADLPAGFAVRYEPASSTLEVGGDWYDVLELPGRRYGVVVGDVVGSGLSAATTMGQLRSAARALLLENNGPAGVLTALDRFAALLPGAFCTTVFCAVIDPEARSARYSSAGHMPGLVAEPDGTVHRLYAAQSVPLAVVTGRERPEATAAIPDDSTVLLYTDGLVERRGEVIDVGIDRAATALKGTLRLAPDLVADHICTALLGDEHHEDDVALLVYRSGHRFPRRPGEHRPPGGEAVPE
ncbi:SpoIIE family protein phosphatase [Streptomyces antarcticus]|uniref:SpoIIE family protein phosphatase n=1 Tax=Streptomyces antarcticus TaxID=2996458 RepID=UPI0022721A8A|nr:SpoIIE family protein phosphatase [Streptomyces sp. H34-AA3]MCY0943086.1 SpoIIE family protein phosphatase [Streptomyces sp. H34-AA3]